MTPPVTAPWLVGLNEYLQLREKAAELEAREISDCTCDLDNFHTCDYCKECKSIAHRMKVLIDLWADNWAVVVSRTLYSLITLHELLNKAEGRP